jgi:intracellular septation protein A
MLAFYGGWRVAGLTAGIAAATVTAGALWWWDRRQGRRGLLVRVGLALVLVQAAVGLLSGSERLYLAQPVLVNGAWSLAFLGSAAAGRPLVGTFAAELADIPDEVRASATYRSIFGLASAVWGAYFLARALVRLWVLANGSIEGFLLVNAATGTPVMLALFAWTSWWTPRAFRRSEEWGPLMRATAGTGG